MKFVISLIGILLVSVNVASILGFRQQEKILIDKIEAAQQENKKLRTAAIKLGYAKWAVNEEGEKTWYWLVPAEQQKK